MAHHQVLVVGGGNAGISLAARLRRDGAPDVAIVESQRVHRYRPLLNYVGAGEARMQRLERPMGQVVPPGCTWIDDEVTGVDPDASQVRTLGGRTHTYEVLVLCPGLVPDWEVTPGLHAAALSGWAPSTFEPDTAPRVWSAVQRVREGTVVFTVPPEPAPCGATALKPLFMACDLWRRTGVLDDIDVRLVLPGRTPTGLPAADDRLDHLLSSYGVDVVREGKVEEVNQEAGRVRIGTPQGPVVVEGVTLAHVVPHYRPATWIADSGLADASTSGLLDVDQETLRHRRHPAVWGIGDAAALGIRPSGGALRKQVDVLAHNIAAARTGGALRDYDGYTVMPITVSRHQLMLVEVDRTGESAPSVPVIDLTKPRRLTWWFDRYGLPVTYFRRILRGKV